VRRRKASDAAAKVFTNSVCVASANAPQAQIKQNGSLLPGAKCCYGQTLTSRAPTMRIGRGNSCRLGCDVSIIDARLWLRSIRKADRVTLCGLGCGGRDCRWSDHAKLRKEAYGSPSKMKQSRNSSVGARSQWIIAGSRLKLRKAGVKMPQARLYGFLAFRDNRRMSRSAWSLLGQVAALA